MNPNPFSSDTSQPSQPATLTCACGKRLLIKPELRGKKIRCPGCQQILVASLPEPTQAFKDSVSNIDASQATFGGVKSDAKALTEFLAPPQAADEIGRLGGYRVLKILGHGGMGVVFKAEDPRLGRFVALKAMLPAVAAAATAKERFFREARAAAALKHDHIVSIHQVGEDRGVPFLTMEFLDGEALDDRLKREARLPLADALRIGCEVALGLAAAHKRGLIHRDIKPANIWLEADTGRAKILDFGLARGDSLGGAEAGQLTQSGMIVGTPAYMPPEQASGKPVDHRCDLYSLGVVLYRMCTGDLPIKGDNPITLLSALALETPAEPWMLNKDIPTELNDLIVSLLSKKREDRPASAQEVVDALQAIDVGAHDPGIRAGLPRSPRVADGQSMPSITLRRRGAPWLAIGVGAVLVAALLAVGVVWPLRPQAGIVDPVNVPLEKVPQQQQHNVAGLSPFDRLDRNDIPPLELKIAGNGDPAKAPPELVAVLGDSRFQHVNSYWGRHRYPDHIAVSPDGAMIAAVKAEHAVRIWDAKSGELLRVLTTADWPSAMVFSPDGSTVYATQFWNQILAWDPHTGKNRRVPFPPQPAAPISISFSRDGKRAVTAGDNGKHHLWNIADGRELLTFSGDANIASELSPDAAVIAFVKDKTLRLWNTADNKDDGVIADLPLEPQSWSFSPDGKVLLVRYPDFVAVCDMKNRTMADQIRRARCYSLSISSDSRFVATAGHGPTIEVWDLATREIHVNLQGELDWHSAVAFFPDNQRVAALDGVRRLRVWDLSGKMLSPTGAQEYSRYIRTTPTGVIVQGGDAAIFRGWDLATRRSRVISTGGYGGSVPAVRPDGRKFAFVKGELSAIVVDMETGEENRLPSGFLLGAIGASPDGRRLAAGGDEGVAVWDMTTGAKKDYPFAAHGLVLTDGGTLVAVRHPKVTVHDLNTEKPLWFHENRFPLDVRASRDGKLLAMSQDRGGDKLPTLLLELATGKTLHELPFVERVAFSPDGRQLATLGDGSLTIWNTETGQRERQIALGMDKAQADLDYAADGRHIVIANGNGTVSIFRLANP